MAIDLLRIHRIISTLLEIKGIIIAKYIKGRDNIQEITRSLLRAGEQELLCTLEEPMDEHCVRDSKDSVRTTIVEQDKVFRQQVSLVLSSSIS